MVGATLMMLSSADHREKADLRKSEMMTGAQDDLAALRLGALRSKILARLYRTRNRNAIFETLHVLHHHHSVHASGQGSAGHDLDCSSCAHFALEHCTCAHFADDAEFAGDIRCAHGEPIPSGTVERRIIAVGGDVFGQHATGGIEHLHSLRMAPLRRDFPQDAFASFMECHTFVGL